MSEKLWTIIRKRWIWALILVVAAVVFYRVKLAPVPVIVKPVTKGPISARVMGTGTIEARYQAAVGSKIQGRLVETLVDQNDPVKSGQLIARLDDAELLQEVGIARATLHAAKATVERVKAEEARAKAVLDQAERTYQRYAALVETKSISQEDAEKSREKLAVAQAESERAIAATVEALRQVTMAEEKLRYSEARLADTRILSPYDGLVIRRDRDAGDIIVPGASIFQIISLKEMWVSAWVDESAMAGLAAGLPAGIIFRSEPKKEYRGKVARLGKEVDRETREFKVDVALDELPRNWAVGQRAEVFIETAKKPQVLVAPVEGLVWNKSKPAVYVVKNGKAVRRPVQLGIQGPAEVEILEGVSEGDQVILKPDPAKVSGGRRVLAR